MIERHASSTHKITAAHLSRKAVVYLRQSSPKQVRESQRLQYALADRARGLGFERVEVVDGDLGVSASLGAAARDGFDRLVASVALGEVGTVLGRELSRLVRTDKDLCHLLVGIGFGFSRGWHAAGLDPVQALRREQATEAASP
jgi:hypothetical protein